MSVVYTPWANLKKTADMAPGQVGFHDRKQVIKRQVEKKGTVVRRLTKTKEERFPDLARRRSTRAAPCGLLHAGMMFKIKFKTRFQDPTRIYFSYKPQGGGRRYF